MQKLTNKEEEIMHILWKLKKAFVKEIQAEINMIKKIIDGLYSELDLIKKDKYVKEVIATYMEYVKAEDLLENKKLTQEDIKRKNRLLMTIFNNLLDVEMTKNSFQNSFLHKNISQ